MVADVRVVVPAGLWRCALFVQDVLVDGST